MAVWLLTLEALTEGICTRDSLKGEGGWTLELAHETKISRMRRKIVSKTQSTTYITQLGREVLEG